MSSVRTVCTASIAAALVFTTACYASAQSPADIAGGPQSQNTKSGPANQSYPSEQESRRRAVLLSDPAFIQGYRDAYATIYERNDYNSAEVGHQESKQTF